MLLKHKKTRTPKYEQLSSTAEKFTIDCEKLLRIFSQNKSEMPNKKIYHYTTTDGLRGILRTNSLWMSNSIHLNDKQEINFAIKQLYYILEKNLNNATNKKFWKNFLCNVIRIPNIFNIYICSLCLTWNHQPAWREYGDNKKGVAVVFNTKNFYSKRRIRNSQIMVGQKVHYHIDDFSDYVRKLIELTEDTLRSMKNACPLDKKRHEDIGSGLLTYFLPILPKLKEKRWAKENEYRIFRYEFASDNLVPKKIYLEYRIPSREKTMGKTKNCQREVALYKFKKEDLCEIWLGSDCELKKTGIKKMLRQYRFPNVMVRRI